VVRSALRRFLPRLHLPSHHSPSLSPSTLKFTPHMPIYRPLTAIRITPAKSSTSPAAVSAPSNLNIWVSSVLFSNGTEGIRLSISQSCHTDVVLCSAGTASDASTFDLFQTERYPNSGLLPNPFRQAFGAFPAHRMRFSMHGNVSHLFEGEASKLRR